MIEIQHTYDYIIRLCRDRLAENGQTPGFAVSVTKAEIEAEKRICIYAPTEKKCEEKPAEVIGELKNNSKATA